MALIIPEKVIAQISGRAMPKPTNDQNTDDIMPARFLKEITFKNMGQYVYADERVKEGKPVLEHPFNNPRYAGADILLAGANYGCGSSREHAPQGLLRYGIKAIIAEGFAEIFAGNCAAIGLVPVTTPKKDLQILVNALEEHPQLILNLNLENKSLNYGIAMGPIGTMPIDLPEGRRQAFLSGTWDAMAVLQANASQAEQVRARLPYMKL